MRQQPMRRALLAALLTLLTGCSGQHSVRAPAGSAESPGTNGHQDWQLDEAKCLSNIRQLTTPCMGLQKAGEAYFAPDGKAIIFQAWPAGDGYYQIFTLKLDDAGRSLPETLLRVSTGAGDCTCSFFSPDGKKIIFASSHLDPRLETTPRPGEGAGYHGGNRDYKWPFNEYMDIFEADPDGSNRKRLTDAPGYDAEGSYSPDGRMIVFCSRRTGDPEIFIMDADGKNPRQITHAPGYDGGPFFSPDGKRIVYRSDRKGDGNMRIFTNDLEGKDERPVTPDDNKFHWCPFWHPSGKYMIYTEADHNVARPPYDLYLIRPDGTGRTQVTYYPGFDGLPVFSPDGRRVMWTSKRGPDNTAQIFVADYRPPAGY